jgi:hypothetical protein
MTMTNVQVSQSHGFNLNESGLAAWAVHMVRHFVERARREARHRWPATIRHTQQFNHFTEHKNMIAARAAGVSHHGFRRRRGWGCAASTRATTRDEGSGDRTGGLLQRAACCAFCQTAGGHHREQRGGFNSATTPAAMGEQRRGTDLGLLLHSREKIWTPGRRGRAARLQGASARGKKGALLLLRKGDGSGASSSWRRESSWPWGEKKGRRRGSFNSGAPTSRESRVLGGGGTMGGGEQSCWLPVRRPWSKGLAGGCCHREQGGRRQRTPREELRRPWRGREPSSLRAGEEGAAARGGRSQGEKKVAARENRGVGVQKCLHLQGEGSYL